MARRSRARYALEYAAFGLVLGALRWLPHGLALGIGRALGRLAHRTLASRRRIARDNLLSVYGLELGEERLAGLARASFESLGCLLVDFARMPRLTPDNALDFVTPEGEEHVLKAIERGDGVLFFTAHFGSWELLPYVPALKGYPLAVIARASDNPFIEGYITRVREAAGNRVISKRGAARAALRLLEAGANVGTLIDQAIPPPRGIPGRFLGRPTYTTGAPAQLALRSGAAVIPAFMVREEGGRRHRLLLGPELELERTGDLDRDVAVNTQRMVDAVEAVVRKWPEQWLWCHRRWREPATASAASERGAPLAAHPKPS